MTSQEERGAFQFGGSSLVNGKHFLQDLWHNYSLVKTAIGEECHGPSKALEGQMNEFVGWVLALSMPEIQFQ